MPDFKKGPNWRTPFGRNNFLRSTQDVKTTSFTFSMEGVPAETIDGFEGQKVLQPGTVLARCTSGPEAGKLGVFGGPLPGTDDEANIVGLNNTFLPWQLMERDVEVAVVYECTAVQEWCIEYEDDSGPEDPANFVRVPLADTTADAMRGLKGLDIMFH